MRVDSVTVRCYAAVCFFGEARLCSQSLSIFLSLDQLPSVEVRRAQVVLLKLVDEPSLVAVHYEFVGES